MAEIGISNRNGQASKISRTGLVANNIIFLALSKLSATQLFVLFNSHHYAATSTDIIALALQVANVKQVTNVHCFLRDIWYIV
jgi:hypothetical protein